MAELTSCDEIDDDDVAAASGKVVRLVGVRAPTPRRAAQSREHRSPIP